MTCILLYIYSRNNALRKYDLNRAVFKDEKNVFNRHICWRICKACTNDVYVRLHCTIKDVTLIYYTLYIFSHLQLIL